MLTMALRGGPAADVWAIRLGGSWVLTAPQKDSDQPGEVWRNRIVSFKKKCSLLYFHMALFTKKKTNNNMTGKKEPHLEARSSSLHRDWTAGAALPTETDNTSGMDIRERDRFGYLSHLRGVTNTASTNHVGHPYNPRATRTHTCTQTHISNTADVEETSQRWVTTSSWAETSNATTVKI